MAKVIKYSACLSPCLAKILSFLCLVSMYDLSF